MTSLLNYSSKILFHGFKGEGGGGGGGGGGEETLNSV